MSCGVKPRLWVEWKKCKRNVYVLIIKRQIATVASLFAKLLTLVTNCPLYRKRWPFQAGTKTQGSLNHGQARIQCIPVNKVVDK